MNGSCALSAATRKAPRLDYKFSEEGFLIKRLPKRKRQFTSSVKSVDKSERRRTRRKTPRTQENDIIVRSLSSMKSEFVLVD